MYVWQWGILESFIGVLAQGTMITLALTAASIVLGTTLGLGIALMRRSSVILVPELARVYTELFRGFPLLVLLVWTYYVLPLLTGIALPPFVAACIALTTHLSAYVAETVRGGIESIPRAQYESGITLGLTPLRVMALIILPQALRNTLPSLFNLYIETLKNSSLASVIAVSELLHVSNGLISATYRPLEIYSAVAFIYLALIIPATLASNVLERNLAARQRTLSI